LSQSQAGQSLKHARIQTAASKQSTARELRQDKATSKPSSPSPPSLLLAAARRLGRCCWRGSAVLIEESVTATRLEEVFQNEVVKKTAFQPERPKLPNTTKKGFIHSNSAQIGAI
jgi:hypothetical protein